MKDTEQLRLVHSIGLNYSPCTERCDIVARYNREGEHIRKPVIHFSRVYNYKSVNMQDGTIGVKELIENGFDLTVWDTLMPKGYTFLIFL